MEDADLSEEWIEAISWSVDLAKQDARLADVAFTLSLFDVMTLFRLGGFRTQLGDIALSSDMASPWAPRIERISLDRGYVSGNVRIVCAAISAVSHVWGHECLTRLVDALSQEPPQHLPPPPMLLPPPAPKLVERHVFHRISVQTPIVYGFTSICIGLSTIYCMQWNDLVQLPGGMLCLFLIFVSLAVRFGGTAAGWFAAVLSAACVAYFLCPPIGFTIEDPYLVRFKWFALATLTPILAVHGGMGPALRRLLVRSRSAGRVVIA